MKRFIKRCLRFILNPRKKASWGVGVHTNLLLVNWMFQKIFRINAECPFYVHYTSLVSGSDHIIIEDWSESVLRSMAVSGGCYIAVVGGSTLSIGKDTIWAWNVNIQTANHDFMDRTKYVVADIVIGRNCWIGGNVTILPGVVLGDNVTVGANAVVTKSFPSNVVIAGIPARIIRDLNQSVQ